MSRRGGWGERREGRGSGNEARNSEEDWAGDESSVHPPKLGTKHVWADAVHQGCTDASQLQGAEGSARYQPGPPRCVCMYVHAYPPTS